MKQTILFVLATIILGCHGQNVVNPKKQPIPEDTIAIDKEKVKKEYYYFPVVQSGRQSTSYEKENGWLVEAGPMPDKSTVTLTEYPPAIDFYEFYKAYHLGYRMIKERVKFMSEVAFGLHEYFDNQGNCIKIVDEDKKFGAIKREDIIQLLEKEGWFNRKTGENIIKRQPVLPTNYTFYREIMEEMKISFKRAVKDDKGNEVEPPKWFIEIGNIQVTRYIIDGNTGEFLKKQTTYEPKDE